MQVLLIQDGFTSLHKAFIASQCACKFISKWIYAKKMYNRCECLIWNYEILARAALSFFCYCTGRMLLVKFCSYLETVLGISNSCNKHLIKYNNYIVFFMQFNFVVLLCIYFSSNLVRVLDRFS
ncbi:hypothetical protein SORBI_3006G079400 [Sorghum bicolor]|uniref:Uncharacterized protein n=1 Tax=Sorghum bicolor TaxID=4558 RepID=A0A1B6PKW9_SORBI|nr:hypothetical protein SORBI_3006G079400 [Sorghum bicolor]